MGPGPISPGLGPLFVICLFLISVCFVVTCAVEPHGVVDYDGRWNVIALAEVARRLAGPYAPAVPWL